VRFLAELFLIALLLWLGWDKSFHTWTDQWRGIQPPPTPATAVTAATGTRPAAARPPFITYRPPPTTPSGQWMWDPNHRSPLDANATKAGAASNPTAPPTQNYWIDANGIKHYNNAPAPSP
jgi:hypothetical protein